MSQYTFLLHLAYSSRGCLAFSWTEFYFCFNKILPAAVIELYFRFPFFHAAKDGMWWRWCYCIAYMRLTTHISAHTIPPKIAPQTNRINCCLSVQCTHTHTMESLAEREMSFKSKFTYTQCIPNRIACTIATTRYYHYLIASRSQWDWEKSDSTKPDFITSLVSLSIALPLYTSIYLREFFFIRQFS